MLTAAGTERRGLATVYGCGAYAFTPRGPTWPLDLYGAGSPRLALRWMRGRAQDIADQLDPAGATPAHHWLTDQREHEWFLTRLRVGAAYILTLFEDATRYVLMVKPGR
ncbi:hypothetical protein [Streptomyces cacaoi]|uniref:hypothetical protein n=1 Tax=Streptomyces cacaoi TaxID=1898 RepID=UPI001CA9EAEC|nr:hypothetical protein [Streptomyces cacaoi]